MSDAEALRYLRWTNATSCSVSYDFGGRVLTYNKVTAIDGQKTVCMDAGVRPEPNRCVVYSFGINNDDWSFEDMIDQVYFSKITKLTEQNESCIRNIAEPDSSLIRPVCFFSLK